LTKRAIDIKEGSIMFKGV